jgi:hypothetical protein
MLDLWRIVFQIWITLIFTGVWAVGTVFVGVLLHEVWMNWSG